MDIKSLTNAIVVLLTEAYPGPPDPSGTWFIDNEPDSGVLGILDTVSVAEASRSVHPDGDPGSTIASHAEHLRWSLANANAALRGEEYNGKWSESWRLLETDQAGWDRLRLDLRREFEAVCQAIQAQTDFPQDEYLLGVLGLIPHAAYHLGNIRQMVERVRG